MSRAVPWLILAARNVSNVAILPLAERVQSSPSCWLAVLTGLFSVTGVHFWGTDIPRVAQ